MGEDFEFTDGAETDVGKGQRITSGLQEWQAAVGAERDSLANRRFDGLNSADQSIGKTCGEMWQPRAVAESTSSVSPGLRENRKAGMEPIMRIVMASNETPTRAMNIHHGVGWEGSFDPSTAEIIRCDEANRRTPWLRPPAQ